MFERWLSNIIVYISIELCKLTFYDIDIDKNVFIKIIYMIWTFLQNIFSE